MPDLPCGLAQGHMPLPWHQDKEQLLPASSCSASFSHNIRNHACCLCCRATIQSCTTVPYLSLQYLTCHSDHHNDDATVCLLLSSKYTISNRAVLFGQSQSSLLDYSAACCDVLQVALILSCPSTSIAAMEGSAPYPWPFDGDLRPANTALIVIDMQVSYKTLFIHSS